MTKILEASLDKVITVTCDKKSEIKGKRKMVEKQRLKRRQNDFLQRRNFFSTKNSWLTSHDVIHILKS